jgi:hypothetical protein
MPTRGTQPRSGRLSRSVARWLLPTILGAVALALVAGAVIAATPVTNGYRGIAYGGGATRPTSDKPQSKLWYTDGSWFAGMFFYKTSIPPESEYRIYRLDQASHDWKDTGTIVDTRDSTHGDYLWHEGSQTLWVVSAYPATTTIVDSAIKVFKYAYNATTNAYTPAVGFPVAIPGTASVGGSDGGAHTASIARDSSGRLWAVWPKAGQVMYSTSTNGGSAWSTPAQVPAQAGNPIRGGTLAQSDTATVVAFGSSVAIGWSDEHLPTADSGGYYVAVIASGADPSLPGSWSLDRLPSLVTTIGERSDNHLSMKAASDGSVYAVGKTRKDTVGCATNRDEPLVEAFRRTPGGTWSVHLVATVGDCVSRPQIVLDEQLGAAWVLMASPNGGGAIHMKSAPLIGPDALVFRDGADTTSQPGIPFVRSATETRIDDATTSKQSLTSASGLVVLANNVPTSTGGGGKWYLHNERALPASDAVPPVGTVTIASGAAFTGTGAVSVAVPASDPGSGPSLVRLSNTPAMTNGVLTDGTSFSYTWPLTWTLAAGDGAKTVYAQWRDAAGNWSTAQQDTIVLDTTGPTGTVSIASGATATKTTSVTLSLTANDGAGSGPASVLVSNSADFTGATPITFAASIPWTLESVDGVKTVHVKFVDALGNVSASAVTDSITLDTTPPTAGEVSLDGGDQVTNSLTVTLTTSGAGGDATAARASNAADMTGATTVPVSGSTSWSLAAGPDGPRTVYVQWADALGNWSASVFDSITVDQQAPVGTVVINGGAIGTKTLGVTLTFPGAHGDVDEIRVGSAPDLAGSTYQGWTPGDPLPWLLADGADGTRTVYAQFKDVGGLESPIVSDTIILDRVRPTPPGAPVHRLSGSASLTSVPVRLTWAAGSDARSGVKGYVVQRSVNGSPYATIATPTGPSLNVALSNAKTYRFRIATVDHAGNFSSTVSGPSFTTARYSEASSTVRYAGTWSTTSSPTYIGGKARYAKARGASATFTFTGKQVAWVSRAGSSSGKARVYVNGTYVQTINLFASTTAYRKLVFTRAWSTSAKRTVRIVVDGTAGHPRVTVDGFFVLR